MPWSNSGSTAPPWERFCKGRIHHHTTFNEQTQPHTGKSRISDVNVAENHRYAKQQILVQSGTQMLREANNLPLTALNS